MKIDDLTVGQKYFITYRSPGQLINRTAVMVYISRYEKHSIWLTNSEAGNQVMPDAWIVDILNVDQSAKCYIGRKTQ